MAIVDPRDELIAELRAQLAAALQEIAELRARLNQNSTNSSKPPSTDPLGMAKTAKAPSGKSRGGQIGHKRNLRQLVALSEVQKVHVLRPEACGHCGLALKGNDPQPKRHQVVEVPEIKPSVTEWQLHTLSCRCGKKTSAQLPAGVTRGAFGPVLSSMVALCTVRFRQSKRLAKELLATLLNVDISLGAICKIEEQTSRALEPAVQEAYEYVKQQALVNADETGWYEDKAEGKKKLVWLWVATTALVTVFRIAKNRGEEAAKQLLGAGFAGILGTDRYSAYNFVDTARRQLCWSHLTRDFQGFIDRGGTGGKIGEKLIDQTLQLFDLWHGCRDGIIARPLFARYMAPIELQIVRLLGAAASCDNKKTRGMAKRMLKFKAALFTFVRLRGVEPTNNVSEQRIRQAVILRKLSFGTDSETGSRFVERMLTVTTTLLQQKRNVLQFLIAARCALLTATPCPSLLPQNSSATA
jgi:transposase